MGAACKDQESTLLSENMLQSETGRLFFADLWGTKSIMTITLWMSPKAKWQKVQGVVINFII